MVIAAMYSDGCDSSDFLFDSEVYPLSELLAAAMVVQLPIIGRMRIVSKHNGTSNWRLAGETVHLLTNKIALDTKTDGVGDTCVAPNILF